MREGGDDGLPDGVAVGVEGEVEDAVPLPVPLSERVPLSVLEGEAEAPNDSEEVGVVEGLRVGEPVADPLGVGSAYAQFSAYGPEEVGAYAVTTTHANLPASVRFRADDPTVGAPPDMQEGTDRASLSSEYTQAKAAQLVGHPPPTNTCVSKEEPHVSMDSWPPVGTPAPMSSTTREEGTPELRGMLPLGDRAQEPPGEKGCAHAAPLPVEPA